MLSPDRAAESGVTGPAADNQDSAAIAFGAGTYFAVWIAKPSGLGYFLVGSRVSAAGNTLDVPPFVIESSPMGVALPAVAFDGTNFVVAWNETTSTGTRAMTRSVAPNGTLVGSAAVDHGAIGQTEGMSIAASSSGQVLTVWSDGRRLHGTGVADIIWPLPSTYRTLVNPDPMQNTDTVQNEASVVFGNGHFEVAFVDYSSSNGPDVYAAAVSTAGVISTPLRVPSVAAGSTDGPIVPAVGFGGGVFLVAYNDFDPSIGNDRDLYARMLDGSGMPTGSNFTVSSDLNDQTLPQIAFGSGSFLVLWQSQDTNNASNSALWGRQYTTAGAAVAAEAQVEPLAPSASALIGELYWRPSALATNGTDFVAAWTHDSSTGTLDDTLASPIASTNIAAAPVPGLLSRAGNQERAAAAANNGTVHLLVWEDSRNFVTSGVDIYGLIVDASGANQGTAFAISTAAGDQNGPQVGARASANGDFLVAWVDQATIAAAIVTPAGSVTPVTGLASSNASDPTIAGVGDGWLLIWNNGGQIVAKKIAAATASGQPTRIDDGTGTVGHPSASFDGTHVLAAWEQLNTGMHRAIVGAWLDSAGTPTGMRPVVASGSIDLDSPSVAGSMSRVVVAWHDPATNAERILLALLADNQASAPTAVEAANLTGTREAPHVAMSGNGVGVVWSDHRSMSPGSQVFFVPARISSGDTLTPLDNNGNGFPLFGNTNPPYSSEGLVSITADGRTLYGGTEIEVDGHGDAVPRVHLRAGGIRGLGDPCDNDGGCDSAHCANNVCCNQACGGTCQYCGSDGQCNQAPTDDNRCATTNCTGLATECVDYMPTARCEAFGICRLPGDPAACMAMPKANGTQCSAVGCASAGGCMDGACVCSGYQSGPTPSSVAPQFANPGCAVGGRMSTGFWLALAMLALVLARRRLLILLALLAGCTSDSGGLIIRVDLVGHAAQVDHVRFILAPQSAPGFPMMATAGGEPAGVHVFASDVDGNGIVDEIVDVDKAYIQSGSLSLELRPRSGGAFGVNVRAIAIDANGNRFAHTAIVGKTVTPEDPQTIQLSLACIGNCSGDLGPMSFTQPFGTPTATTMPAAVAAGRITTGAHADDVVVGLPGSGPGDTTVLGEVRVLLRPAIPPNNVTVPPLRTNMPGDRFGAAVATGDVLGTGTAQVIVGAPGTGSNGGGVFVIEGGDWTSPPQVGNHLFLGQGTEQMGSALAIADVDGDGKLDIVAGAPFGQNVHVLRKDQAAITISEPAIVGFGSAVAAANGLVLVGAPEANRVRLYQVGAGGAAQLAYEWSGVAGGFGAQVAFADVDGDGRLDLIASAPAEGSGTIYVLRASDRASSPQSVTAAHSAALHAGTPSQLGAQLAVVPGPAGFGDDVVFSAPLGTTHGYLVAGGALVAHPYMTVDAAMAPVAARLMLPMTTGQTAFPLASGDIDGDGVADLVAATASGVTWFGGVAW